MLEFIRIYITSGPKVQDVVDEYPFLFCSPFFNTHFFELTGHNINAFSEMFEISCNARIQHYKERKGNVKIIRDLLGAGDDDLLPFKLFSSDFKEEFTHFYQIKVHSFNFNKYLINL